MGLIALATFVALAGFLNGLGAGLHHPAQVGNSVLVLVVVIFVAWRLGTRWFEENSWENFLKFVISAGILPFAVGAFIGALWTIVG